jgi:hypothetical protein
VLPFKALKTTNAKTTENQIEGGNSTDDDAETLIDKELFDIYMAVPKCEICRSLKHSLPRSDLCIWSDSIW